MSTKDYTGTRKNVSKTMLGNLAETLGFKKGLSYKQLMTEAASLSQKSVRQALKRAGWKGAIALGFLEAVGYGASKVAEKIKNTPTSSTPTKSKTKTYAEMVKEDKEKGKSKVLSRRAPDAPPSKPKKLKDKKEEKKFNLKTGGKGTAKERLDEIKKEKLAAKQKKLVKGSIGAATGLKMPTADQVGLKKLPTPVRNKMGYMYGGGMAKKPRMSSMDYRKGGLLVISIDMMKKNKKGKKE